MIIKDDKSQWKTMTGLAEYVNSKSMELNPFIIDIGAANGILNSNSYNLIMDNNWSGLLIEPNPKAYDNMWQMYCLETHGTKNKDEIGIVIMNNAIANYNGKITLNLPENEDDDQLASIVQNFPKKVIVECITINELFKRKNDIMQDPGILSVDTEGYDLEVLKQWMATTNRPQIIVTESWPHLAYANLEKMSLLKNASYEKILHFGENEIFIKRNNV